MRVQLWHVVVLLIPALLALALYLVVRAGIRDGSRGADRADGSGGA